MANEEKTNGLGPVADALDALIISVEGKDMDLFPQVVAHDPDLVWIGSGAGDWLEGYAALEGAVTAQNAALENINIALSDENIHLSPDGCFAWATNRWVFEATMGDQEIELPLRCTWILEKREPGWVLVHFHKSVGMDG